MRSRKNKMDISPMFCQENEAGKAQHPYDTVKWSKRTISLDGVFLQKNVEVPVSWSDRAAFILASKYFRGHEVSGSRESSLKHVLDRIIDPISEAGTTLGYFDKANAKKFNYELKKMIMDQRASFNSPVFFNMGAEPNPQGSACFILGIKDDLKDIARIQTKEIEIFSKGSGSGVNLSALRGAGEPLSRGGWASGPMSFFRGYNAWGGTIRSGGILRRASKFNRLDCDHPDVYDERESGSDFISFKAHEERKARALVLSGYTPEEAYATVSGQNANLSVGLTDEFMRAAIEDREWPLRSVVSGKIMRVVSAKKMMESIAQNCHFCGDPGVQFHTTINDWNTCIKSGEITSSNPCGEFLFLPNSACNLASINLSSFLSLPEGLFFEKEFCHAAAMLIIAQDIICQISGYPTEEIRTNSIEFRPLGLGFTDLGGMIMSLGLPYDSNEARMWGASISALMTGMAYKTSIGISKVLGPFKHFGKNKRSMMKVLKQHESKLEELIMSKNQEISNILRKAKEVWDEVIRDTPKHGVRNAQVTLLAPTGTTALIMDAATTGVESGNWLTTKKKLVDGGTMVMPLTSIPKALNTLGYSDKDKETIQAYIKEHHTVEGCSTLKRDHLPVFDTAYRNGKSERAISPDGHLLMLSACQPFISGGISKTIGRPNSAKIEEFLEIYYAAWKLGLKSVTVYRDGSKVTQPISGASTTTPQATVMKSQKRKLPRRRPAEDITTKIGATKLYTTIGFYPDTKKVGEVFLRIGKAGSALTGWVDAFALAISIGLQHQIPLSTFAEKFADQSFDPRGFTDDPEIRFARSVPDYVFRILAQFDLECQRVLGMNGVPKDEIPQRRDTTEIPISQSHDDIRDEVLGDVCGNCGNLMHRINSLCKQCSYCSNSEGQCGG